MWAPVVEVTFLAGAGVLAGVASSSGAIGSLVSYPALLAVGIPPLVANVTNAVAVVGVGVGSTLRSGPELRDARARLPNWPLRTWAGLSASGAALGATVLLLTPGGLFEWIVPFLIASAALALLLQPRIAARRGAHRGAAARSVFPYGLVAVAAYEGYFGAAAGVLTLALVMVTMDAHLPRANALKNLLLGVADVVAAVEFSIFGPVRWLAAVPLGLGFLAGGTVGPTVARRVSADVLRIVISIAGFCLAGWLFTSVLR